MDNKCPKCGKYTQARDDMTARLRREVEWRRIWKGGKVRSTPIDPETEFMMGL